MFMVVFDSRENSKICLFWTSSNDSLAHVSGMNISIPGVDTCQDRIWMCCVVTTVSKLGKKEEGTYGHRYRVRMHLQIVLDHNLGLGKLILSERENEREEKQTVATHQRSTNSHRRFYVRIFRPWCPPVRFRRSTITTRSQRILDQVHVRFVTGTSLYGLLGIWPCESTRISPPVSNY